jgi:hypothetical protein
MDVRRRWLASAKQHTAADFAPATSAATADWMHDDSAGSGLGLRRGRLAAAGISVDSAAASAATSADVELPDDFSGSGLGVC